MSTNKVPLSKGGFRGMSGYGGMEKDNPLTPFFKGEFDLL